MTKKLAKFRYKDGPVVLISRQIAYTFPLSYAYLAGYLKEKGENVSILFKDSDYSELVKKIMELNPVLVGFGNLYPEMDEIRFIITLLNQAGRQFPIVIGGQMVTPTPEFAVKISGADFGVVGEGEIILHQLVNALRSNGDVKKVKGLIIREKDNFISTGSGDYIKNLEKLPPVPYDLFPQEEWLPIGRWYAANAPQPHWRFNDRAINIHGGRGCPYHCNFCYHHSRPRYRSVHTMISEGYKAASRFSGNMLYFSDDLVLATPNRAKKLVNTIRSLNIKTEYSVSTRFDILDRLDDKLLYEMKETGCRIMGLGIESGSDRILKIIGKNCTADMILNNLKRLKKVGILPTVSIMIGQHTETIDDVEASIELMIKTVRDNPNIQYAFTITTPFPGSKLYNTIFQNGLLKTHEEFYNKYFSSPGEWNQVVNLSKMTDDEVVFMYNKIKNIYAKEKRKAIGNKVILIKNMQIAFGISEKLTNKIFAVLFNSQTSNKVKMVFRPFFDLILHKLDDLRLKSEMSL